MDGGGGEIDVYKGQVEEEEIHGVVEVVVWADSQNDEQVSKHSDQRHGEEMSKIREADILVPLKFPEEEILKFV